MKYYPYYLTCYLLIIATAALFIPIIRYKKIKDFVLPVFSLLLTVTVILFLPWCGMKYQSIIPVILLFFLIISFFLHSYFVKPVNNYGGSVIISRVYLIIIIIVSFIFLLKDLGVYAGTMLCWEMTVIKDFGHAFLNKISITSYMADCFLWDDGLVSSGAHSLLYGGLTYGLFHVLGFSPWSLRIFSVIFTLLSTFLFYIIGRRFYGPSIGILASMLFILNTNVLFYGRYGTSLAATVTVTLLAILTTWTLLDNKSVQLWRGLICAFILYIATLHYAPARLFVIFLLCQILIFAICNRNNMSGKKIIAIILIFVSLFSIVLIEKHFKRGFYYFNARGEQYFNFCKDAYYIRDYLGQDIAPEKMTFYNKIELFYAVLKRNIPKYLSFVSPVISIKTAGMDNTDILDGDPPRLPLYYFPFFPFLIFGLCHSIMRIRNWKHAVPLAWLIIITLPILLTNRVDAHRTFLLTIPVTLFISFGFWEFWQILKKLAIPEIYIHVVALLLILTLIYHNGDNLFYKNKKRLYPAQQNFILDEVNFIPRSVSVASLVDCRISGSLDLLMLEKARLYKGFTGNILEDRLRFGICDDHKEIDKSFISELEVLLDRSTLVLLPASRYVNISCKLKKLGYHVVLKENSYISLFIVNK